MEEENNHSVGRLLTVVGLVVATIILVVVEMKAKSRPVVIPTGYVAYMSEDKFFQCEGPNGWSQEEGASGATSSWARWSSEDAKVEISSDEAGSFMADAMITPSNQAADQGSDQPGQNGPAQDQPAPAAPITKLHAASEKDVAENFSDYKEGDPTDFASGVGPAQYSIFSANNGNVMGYRITILSKERRFIVLAFCPEKDWAQLKPTFLDVINSIKLGPGT